MRDVPAIARFSACLLVGCLYAAGAHAQEETPCRVDQLPEIQEVDTEDPEKLLDGRLLTLWSGLDSDEDGYIEGREAAVEPELFACFGVLDVEKDGQLSAAEFARFRFIRTN